MSDIELGSVYKIEGYTERARKTVFDLVLQQPIRIFTGDWVPVVAMAIELRSRPNALNVDCQVTLQSWLSDEYYTVDAELLTLVDPATWKQSVK